MPPGDRLEKLIGDREGQCSIRMNNQWCTGIRVPPRRINEIVHWPRSITADTALRLAKYFGTSATFWMNLQARYDLEEQSGKLGSRLEREVRARLRPQ